MRFLLWESGGLSDMQESGLPMWRSRCPNEIVWAFFDDNYVAYHPASGKTHFLNAASRHLICDVLSEPSEFSAIAEEFASEIVADDPDAYLERMQAMLDRLEHLGLVEIV